MKDIDATRSAPSDATGLTHLLQRTEAGLQQGLLPVEVYADEAVFKAEMERIFARTWVFVAHESEIPNKGDYVLRRIGLDQVIVTRDDAGKVNVLSAYCRHRGTQVVSSDRGNTQRFRCAYHGWLYKTDGSWAGAPHARDAYGGQLDAREWGLLRAPRVGLHQGFIFASLAEDGPTLQEHLGHAAWVLDAICGLHPKGMRVVGVPERYQVRADWKNGAENFAGDCYHVDVAHLSNEKIGLVPGLQTNNEDAKSLVIGDGHGFLCHPFKQMMGGNPFGELWMYPPHIRAQFDLERLDEHQQRLVKDLPPTIGTVFPNLSYIRVLGTSEAGVPPTVYTSFRQWQPLAPGLMEVWTWQFVWDFMDEADVRASYAAGVFAFGSAGTFEQDDTVVWEGAQRAARSVWNRKAGMMMNFQQGVGGRVPREKDDTWGGPGVLYRNGYGEFGQMSFYHRWLAEMQQPSQG